MTRDDVIRMATSANILEPLGYECPHRKSWRDDVVRGLERFAALVAAHEREECAKLCDWNERGHFGELAAAIRARR